jgi:hypothetical protein
MQSDIACDTFNGFTEDKDHLYVKKLCPREESRECREPSRRIQAARHFCGDRDREEHSIWKRAKDPFPEF